MTRILAASFYYTAFTASAGLLSCSAQAATPGATPAPVGPYSSAVDVGDFIFLAGQIAIDPATGKLDPSLSIEAQTMQVWANIREILKTHGLDVHHVVQAQVFLVDIEDFAAMNGAYAAAVKGARPARTTVAVAALPFGASIEIAVIAARPKPAPACERAEREN